MNELFDLLAQYITALEHGARVAGPREEPVYRAHRGAAAQLEAALRRADAQELKRLVDEEERTFGWEFLEGSHGEAVHAAFSAFAYRARMSGATFAA
jgi:hypothetical protein